MRANFHNDLAMIERRMLRDLDLASATVDGLSAVLNDPSAPTPAYIETDTERLRESAHLSLDRLIATAALQAPVARDLLLVTGLLHVGHHQGLIANQFELIVAQLMEMDPDEQSLEPVNACLATMASLSAIQLTKAAAAFASRDAVAAEALTAEDEVINRLNRRVFGLLLKDTGGRGRRELLLHQMLIARSLERLGDNAIDIAEQAAFVATGHFREFTDAGAVSRAVPPDAA